MEKAQAHRTQVLLLTGPKHVAVCSCGHIGVDRDTKTKASLDANDHKVVMGRQTGPKAAL